MNRNFSFLDVTIVVNGIIQIELLSQKNAGNVTTPFLLKIQ